MENATILAMDTLSTTHPTTHFHTTYGMFVAELYPERTPLTVKNFIDYVEDGFYEHTLIHRVIDNFIIQGGGFESGMVQKTTRHPIANESHQSLRHKRGTIAMARLPDEPDSATSQFFINTRDNELLNEDSEHETLTLGSGYCVFGRIIKGMEVVERIECVETHTIGDHEHVPVREIFIEKIELQSGKS